MPKCFKPRSIQLRNPIESTGEIISHVNVPCGKCVNCIKRRRMEWCFRMEQELLNSKCSYFVTFTYDPDNVPWDKYGNMVLVDTTLNSKKLFLSVNGRKPIKDKYLKKMKLKGHVDKSIQGFFKRLRSTQIRFAGENRESWLYNLDMKNDKIKFFVCGEYGGRYGRPHFHAIIFNSCIGLIKDCWNMGNVDISRASAGSIGYCTKYMDKWRDKKQDWKRPVEFNFQSNGLGLCFVDKMKDWYKKNLDVNYVMNEGGVKVPMPRYFRYKMFSDKELSIQCGLIYRAVIKEKEDYVLEHGIDRYIRKEKMVEALRGQKFERQIKKRGF